MNKLSIAGLLAVALSLVLNACGGGGGGGSGSAPSAEAALASTIRNDTRLPLVRAKARQVVAKNLSAGTVYAAVYIRDLNTFIDLAIESHGAPVVRSQLLQFFEFQADDGLIPDAIEPNGNLLRATVESDQESSLVQAVGKYVAATGDTALLSQQVRGVPVIERMEKALMYLYTQRFAAPYRLVWGGTRADWGDVQPEDSPGTNLTENSHPSISIYDNAMLALALVHLQTLERAAGRDATPWTARQADLRTAVRAHLWTGTQFIPHLYLEKGSPFPASFDEARIYFQGGTAVAIQAGLLEPAEVELTFARMIKNKVDSGSGTVGVTLYPSYPANFFANTFWMGPEYHYQNGGDWPWFGGRIIQQMVARGQPQMAHQEIGPMLDRVLRDDGFYEWYSRDGKGQGSAEYRGSAGQIALAIDMLLQWANAH
ncbi:amylo-alpha-1,6-glucosidase [Ramlibacter sp. WS9]|uniref:amylo-alpha-1,6-glucosidase n=1 Tax=Ramlibacter sp. WS9 TaxID=1882741 RepID=UPI0011422044|nr:amylo-alpha-1,6-glucosidase [Ramlibacter sp. WS9]ROZ74408.1 hypothetical protein EEB15_17920 [Ramlibacter sp. WS9]